ncbi:MAG: hypothetical protein HQ515_13770 [Phycisphaeraceae bacterium]|nr:hypothetical protein [Phycisphaeraceae bacterium]
MDEKAKQDVWRLMGAFLVILVVAMPAGKLWASGTGTILLEVWEDIGTGDVVVDLTDNPRYPDDPSWWKELTSFDFWDLGEEYGSRVRGYLHPQTSGVYTFWIASDNCSELWLSPDENPGNAALTAAVLAPNTYTAHYGWDEWPSQKSVPITLVGGQKYYTMSLHKEGVHGGGVCVAWQGPDCPERAVIDGEFLSAYELAPEKTQQLIKKIVALDLPAGIENSLVSKLENAINSLETGQDNAAINKLEAFINQVKAQRDKKQNLTNEQAGELIANVQAIIKSI